MDYNYFMLVQNENTRGIVMRKKVYYLKDEITNNLYTSGSEWMLEDNTEYIGLYHSYITGEVYTQPKWNLLTSKKLIKFKNIIQNNSEYTTLKPNIKTRYELIKNIIPEITSKNIKDGFVTRYIIQNVSSKIIYEVNADQFELYTTNEIDTNLYMGVVINWFITGIRFNSELNTNNTNVITKTVSQKNLEQIITASKTITNLQNYFTNLEQFYSDNTFVAVPDINGLK
jgi:hypothetical protein